MNKNRIRVFLFLLMLSLGFLSGDSTGSDLAPAEQPAASAPTVTLRAASEAAIVFKTQNGVTVDGVPPETRDAPHLVLRRNGALTDPAERTLVVEVTGVEVPPPGATVTLSVETQRGDPDRAEESPPRIKVWRESRWIANSTGGTQPDVTVVFRHEFTATIRSEAGATAGAIATPTDYMRYDLVVTTGRRPLYAFRQDYALLLENQWIAPLPQVADASPGAAPDELVVYYNDMVPFRRDGRDASAWLPRDLVSDYVRGELIPAMVEAFRLQTDDWGFPWYPEWTGHRPANDAERLSVALADGEAWFHGQTLGQGNAGIYLNVNRGLVEYETFTDGLMSTFHHELFHNHQRNLHQYLGGSGQVGGAGGAWGFFAEGIAVLASSVGQPGVHFGQTWGARAYALNARGFVGRAGISQGDLNKSYARMNPYHAAAYWRFLYEQCGGLQAGVEDPAAGMVVIRQVLVTLYGGDIVNIEASTDLVSKMPAIMDEALRGSSCPFGTYQESLLASARAIYALRLDGGRCQEPGLPAGCGFYDPETLYHKPGASTLTYRGEEIVYSASEQLYPAGIPSSFGMDLVEVELDAAANGTSLTIKVYGTPGSAAVFNVQLLRLTDEILAAQSTAPEAVARIGPERPFVHVIPQIDTTEYNRLSLVITRVDAEERLDGDGAYTIVLRADA